MARCDAAKGSPRSSAVIVRRCIAVNMSRRCRRVFGLFPGCLDNYAMCIVWLCSSAQAEACRRGVVFRITSRDKADFAAQKGHPMRDCINSPWASVREQFVVAACLSKSAGSGSQPAPLKERVLPLLCHWKQMAGICPAIRGR